MLTLTPSIMGYARKSLTHHGMRLRVDLLVRLLPHDNIVRAVTNFENLTKLRAS